MKRTATLVVFLASVLIGSLGYTQEMPQGTVQVNTWCTINEGHTFAEAVEVGRYVDNEWENGPLQIFFRQAIAGPNLPPNGLLRVVYWNNLEHWSRGLAALPSPVGPRAHLNEIMSCDESNRSFFLTRNIGGRGGAYGGGENNVSMSSARACQVKPGNTIEDVYSALAENNAPYREQGDIDNALWWQLSQPIHTAPSCGEISLLGKVLDSASRFEKLSSQTQQHLIQSQNPPAQEPKLAIL